MRKRKQFENIIYDRESRVLSFGVKRSKSVDSDIQNHVVIDYDKKGEIVRIDFYDMDFGAFRESVQSIKSFASNLNMPVLVK